MSTSLVQETVELAAPPPPAGVGRYPADGYRTAPASTDQAAEIPAPVRSFCEHYGLTREVFARICGASLRSVAKWVAGEKPGEANARKLVETRRLLEALAEVVEPAEIGAWLARPNPAFENSTPLQAIERGESDRIWRMIYYLGSGEPG